jgi:iron-sulfur cluster repair protein YtfE (RIC family)
MASAERRKREVTMRSLRPSQVRARILREHAALRSKLDRLAELTAQLEAGLEEAPGQVLELVQALHRDLQDHIDFEDELLVPALAEVDAWGPVRAAELMRHHTEQRAELLALTERSASESPDGLVHLVVELIADLRKDMAHEDSDLLAPDLLRDDVVAIDGEAG